MNNENLRKCDKCKNTKPKKLFYRYKYCKKCYYKNYIENNLITARIANHLELTIDEVNNITTLKDEPGRNALGEHERYDELMLLFCKNNICGNIITDEVINNFLDEPII